MKMHHVACVVAALALWPTVAHSNQRACLDLSSGPLPGQDIDNNIYRKLLFNRAGKKYYAETFSDRAEPQSNSSELCLRWEAQNASGDGLDIDAFSWPSAGIFVSKFRPGDDYREYKSKREQVKAARRDNPVYAFENERQITQSWVVVGGPEDAGAIHRSTRPNLVLPGLSLHQGSFLERPIVEITFGASRAPPPPIEQVVGFGVFGVTVISRVLPGAGTLTISTQASVRNPRGLDVQLGFPSLQALQQINPGQIAGLQDAANYVKTFEEFKKRLEPGRQEWPFASTISANLSEPVRIFRVNHPVIVSAQGVRHCYLVAAYSPIPITLELSDCR